MHPEKQEKPGISSEILINATLVAKGDYADLYEFVLDDNLHIIECVHVASLANGVVIPIDNFKTKLNQTLFELNHVRVNPRLDNTKIINVLTNALTDIGVAVSNQPDKNSLAVCYKPLGEIKDTVRFYFGADGKTIFLSNTKGLRVVR